MENTAQQHEMEGEMEDSKCGDLVKQECELRLVLLGWAGSGKSTLGNAILGFKAFETRLSSDSERPVTVKCEKKCATVSGRKVDVVDTPDWFYSERPPEEVHRQLSLCESLSAPGPHTFLLCVPVHRPNEQDLQALDALEAVFGSGAVRNHTIVVFTHTERLSKDLTLEEYLKTERQDLLQLVEKCGDRYHVLKLKGEEEEEEEEEKERKSVEELLDKVEEMVKESREEFYTFPPLMQMNSGSEGRDETEGDETEGLSGESMRRRRGQEEEEECEEMAEGSTDGLEVLEGEDGASSPPAPPPSFLRWLWDGVVGWVLWLPSLLRGSTLLGSFVGLFLGGAMGATVGSVATEVGRRKPQKTKTK